MLVAKPDEGHDAELSRALGTNERVDFKHPSDEMPIDVEGQPCAAGSKWARLGEKQGPGPELVFAFGSFDAFLTRRGRSGRGKKPNVSSALGSARSLELIVRFGAASRESDVAGLPAKGSPPQKNSSVSRRCPSIDGCSGSSRARLRALVPRRWRSSGEESERSVPARISRIWPRPGRSSGTPSPGGRPVACNSHR